MKINELISEIETTKAVESILVKHKNNTFQSYPWLKSKSLYKFIIGEESLAQKSGNVLLRQVLSLFYGCWNWFRKYDIWAFTNSVERIEIEGKYFDKLFDGFQSIPNTKTLIIELQLFSKFKQKHIASKYAVSKALFLLSEEIYGRLFLRKFKIENQELIAEIETLLKVKIDTNGTIRKYLAQYYMMHFWLKILPNPKAVFLSVSYSHFGYILAFKEKGIRVIEMQHGVISKGHHAYFYTKKMEQNQFPDAALVWGENEQNFLTSETEFPCPQIIPIGRSVIDLFAQKIKNSTSITSFTVSLQDGKFGDLMLDFLLKFNKENNSKYNFYLQRRRTSEADYLSKFEFPANFHFFKGNIYENIAETDAHITAYSTSGIEALAIGKPSIFLNFQNKAIDVFGVELENHPYVFFVNTFDELENALKSLINYKSESVKNATSALIYPNYFENISSFIASELQK